MDAHLNAISKKGKIKNKNRQISDRPRRISHSEIN